MGKMLVNAMLFNASWLAIVVTQSNLLACVIVALHLMIHFSFVAQNLLELKLIALVFALGLVLDQLFFRVGIFRPISGEEGAPFWMSCLWPVLATTLCHAFSGLRGRYTICVLFGAVGGAASYLAGMRLSSLSFADAFYGPLAIGLVWALLFPALLALAHSPLLLQESQS